MGTDQDQSLIFSVFFSYCSSNAFSPALPCLVAPRLSDGGPDMVYDSSKLYLRPCFGSWCSCAASRLCGGGPTRCRSILAGAPRSVHCHTLRIWWVCWQSFPKDAAVGPQLAGLWTSHHRWCDCTLGI